MTSHALGDAVDALVTLISRVSGVAHCERGPLLSNQIPAGRLPHVQVIEGGDQVSHNITSTTQLRTMVGLRLIYNPQSTSEAAAAAIREGIIDALSADDFTLDGTCLSCLPAGGDPPLTFPAKGGLHVRDFYVDITLWRDF